MTGEANYIFPDKSSHKSMVQFMAPTDNMISWRYDKPFTTFAYFNTGTDAIYAVESYCTIITVTPVHIRDKSAISGHLEQIYLELYNQIRSKHGQQQNYKTLSLLHYRLYFYFPETLIIANFDMNPDHVKETVLGRWLNTASPIAAAREYLRSFVFTNPISQPLQQVSIHSSWQTNWNGSNGNRENNIGWNPSHNQSRDQSHDNAHLSTAFNRVYGNHQISGLTNSF